MADTEKNLATEEVRYSNDHSGAVNESNEGTRLPPGWKYKSFKIAGITVPWYASPKAQLIIVSFVCFLCPGMFNALGGMGGGGQVDPHTADLANTWLYGVFAVVGFTAGSVVNRLGIKPALAVGGTGYSVYVASFLCYNYTANDDFCIFAGAWLGFCAGLLWTAQGTIMMSYPSEAEKGRFISIFWVIFNLGAVIGSLIPLGQNINHATKGTVSNGTYVGFLVLTFLGALSSLTLTSVDNVIRKDGSKVILMKNPTWTSELFGMFETLREDPWIMFMFPMFFASNWFYNYQFNDFNAAVFDVRTRALNNTLYWAMQMFGAVSFGYFLDLPFIRRPTKAIIAWGMIFVLTMVIWGGGYAFQTYTRAEVGAKTYVPTDWTSSGYVGPMFLYMFYGFFDAAWQTYVYWTMGSLSNNSRKLANFAGFYKGIQSAGSSASFAIDSRHVAYIKIFASCWGLLATSLVVALPLVLTKIKDTVPVEKDLAFTDETYEDVKPMHRSSIDVE